jgi:hypothetical protein
MLSTLTAEESAPSIDVFRQGLRELGYVEGQNVALEMRSADAKLERLPGLAAELVALNVDVIVARANPAFQRCTARRAPPTKPVPEAWFAVGRRGGKGWTAATLAVYIACARPHDLKRAERGVVMVMAGDRAQAGEVFRYIRALLESWALHQAGKHAESVAKYDEAAKSGWDFATPADPAGGNANVFDAHAEA